MNSAGQIIRQRRSLLACDGKTSIPAQRFYRMLGRVMPRVELGVAASAGRQENTPVTGDPLDFIDDQRRGLAFQADLRLAADVDGADTAFVCADVHDVVVDPHVVRAAGDSDGQALQRLVEPDLAG